MFSTSDLNSLEAASTRNLASLRACTKAECMSVLRLDLPMSTQSGQIGTPYSYDCASCDLQKAHLPYAILQTTATVG